MEDIMPSISDNLNRLIDPSPYLVVRREPILSPKGAEKHRIVRTREIPNPEFLNVLEEFERLDLDESAFEALLEHVERSPTFLEDKFSELEEMEAYNEEEVGTWSDEDVGGLILKLPARPLLALVDLGAPLDDDSIVVRANRRMCSDASVCDVPEERVSKKWHLLILAFPVSIIAAKACIQAIWIVCSSKMRRTS
jgi:hypothetical protein